LTTCWRFLDGPRGRSKHRVDLSKLVQEARSEVSADINGRRIAWEIQELPSVDADPALLRP